MWYVLYFTYQNGKVESVAGIAPFPKGLSNLVWHASECLWIVPGTFSLQQVAED